MRRGLTGPYFPQGFFSLGFSSFGFFPQGFFLKDLKPLIDGMKRIVGIILTNKSREILLIRRENRPDIPAPGKWTLVGGHVEVHESSEEALVREVEEEIGLRVHSYERFGEFHDEEARRYVYIGRIDKCLEELTLGEGQDFGFFSPEYASSNLDLSEPTRRCLAAYLLATENQ